MAAEATTAPTATRFSRLKAAGLDWSPAESRLVYGFSIAAGSVVGILLAQGDLFLSGRTRSIPGLAIAGGFGGYLLIRIWMTQRIETRRATLRQELPIVADMLSLNVLAGESIPAGLERLAGQLEGVAATLIGDVLDDYHNGGDFTEVLIGVSHAAPDRDTARFFDLLAGAHRTGGRLADDLSELAKDFRAGLGRELTVEGGRRSLAVYGPIFALMIPVTLLFLIYPTVAGLQLFAG
jgi:tight adherence protein C